MSHVAECRLRLATRGLVKITSHLWRIQTRCHRAFHGSHLVILLFYVSVGKTDLGRVGDN